MLEGRTWEMLNYKRYKRVPVVDFPERTWPNKEIMKAPVWCSVDLRRLRSNMIFCVLW